MSYAISGATNIGAADGNLGSITFVDVAGYTPTRAYSLQLWSGLAAGSTTFTAKYRRVTAGSAYFQWRTITVIPI